MDVARGAGGLHRQLRIVLVGHVDVVVPRGPGGEVVVHVDFKPDLFRIAVVVGHVAVIFGVGGHRAGGQRAAGDLIQGGTGTVGIVFVPVIVELAVGARGLDGQIHRVAVGHVEDPVGSGLCGKAVVHVHVEPDGQGLAVVVGDPAVIVALVGDRIGGQFSAGGGVDGPVTAVPLIVGIAGQAGGGHLKHRSLPVGHVELGVAHGRGGQPVVHRDREIRGIFISEVVADPAAVLVKGGHRAGGVALVGGPLDGAAVHEPLISEAPGQAVGRHRQSRGLAVIDPDVVVAHPLQGEVVVHIEVVPHVVAAVIVPDAAVAGRVLRHRVGDEAHVGGAVHGLVGVVAPLLIVDPLIPLIADRPAAAGHLDLKLGGFAVGHIDRAAPHAPDGQRLLGQGRGQKAQAQRQNERPCRQTRGSLSMFSPHKDTSIFVECLTESLRL